MCGTCGCSDNSRLATVDTRLPDRPQSLPAENKHKARAHNSNLHARQHGSTLAIEQKILAKNDQIARQNREWFEKQNILALNFVSSPGSGKTTLLVHTIECLQAEVSFGVIEGDQETLNDTRRIHDTGCPAIQINTGMGCHLEANAIATACQKLNPPPNSVIAIENVGNLVCPALFDLGEAAKVIILSVTEGEDKPLKYPYMFQASQVMLLTKIDLLPHLSFDVAACVKYAKAVNPKLKIFQVSAITGEGFQDWCDWIEGKLAHRLTEA